MERPWVTSPSYEAAIKVILEARSELGLSQRALAERLGKPRAFISKIESRERRLDFVEFIVVARAIGLTPGELIDKIASGLSDEIEF
jgi:transcriptional regulator with XRE-family HTH domain